MFKVRLRPNEKLSDAVRRFRKLTSGIKSKLRSKETYEKPSDKRRRERRRAEVRIRNAQRDAG
ncbi:MAG TPA: 30S ribosomal protein S21 [Planctomycetaceae bacterium]|nr:30S ribosomal protein S21 [Planctomycetaceae bacterium]